MHPFLHLRLASARNQVASCIALLGAALALSLSAVLGTMLADSSRAAAAASLNSVAHNAAKLLSDGLDQRRREVQILAASPTLWVEGIDSARVEQVIERSQALNPYSAWMGVADAGGTVRMASGRLLVGAKVAERPWFIAGTKDVHVGDVHPAKLLAQMLPPGQDGGPQRFVDFSAPIRRDGQLLGVLGIHGSFDWTRATIESLLPIDAAASAFQVFVFDRQGRPIYAPSGVALAGLGTRLPAGPVVGPSQAAVVEQWQDGTDYLTAAVRLLPRNAASDLGWTVVARQPVSVGYAAASRGARVALLLGLVGAALTTAVGWVTAARLTRSLRRIADDAGVVERAATPTEMPRRGGSLEVQQLSSALNGMTRRLLQANAELEQRVGQRTAELEQANAALERLAHHDPLTGLLNRRGFDERLRIAVASARRRRAPLSLLMVDADHFKQVNDRFGHDVGDRVLVVIAQTLCNRLREADCVARIGGEEFLVLLADTGSIGALHVAESLVNTFRHTPMPGPERVTISCGMTQLDVWVEEPVAALGRADLALYQAKQSGRNRFCVAERDVCVTA